MLLAPFEIAILRVRNLESGKKYQPASEGQNAHQTISGDILKNQHSRSALTRRQALKLGLGVGGTAMLRLETVEAKDRDKDEDEDDDNSTVSETTAPGNGSAGSCTVTPWERELAAQFTELRREAG